MSKDNTYTIILVDRRGLETQYRFSAESRELAARSALVKYPYHHVKSVEKVK